MSKRFPFLILLLLFVSNATAQKPSSKLEVEIELKNLETKGRQYLRYGKIKKLEPILEKMKDQNPNSEQYLFLLGAYRLSLGNITEAELPLKRVLDINSRHDPSMELLGVMAAKQNEWHAARNYFQSAASLSEYNPFYRMNLAISNWELDDLDAAQTEAEKAIELKPNFFQAKILLLRILLQKEDRRAVDLAKEILTAHPTSSEVQDLAAKSYFLLSKDYKEVVSILQDKRDLDYSELKMLSKSYFNLSRENETIKTYENIRNEYGLSFQEFLEYWKILIAKGDESKATQLSEDWIRKYPDRRKEILASIQKEKDRKFGAREIQTEFPIRAGN